MPTMRYVIQHVPGKREETLGRSLERLPEAVVVACDGRPWQTFIRCLTAGGDDGHWHLEDDVVLAPDFLERAKAAVAAARGGVVRGFGTGLHSGWMPGSSYLFNQCTWLPGGYGRAIATFAAGWPGHAEHPTGFDLVIRDFLVSRRERYWLESPSLVQHAQTRSLLGPRSRNRTSTTFTAQYGRL